MILLLISSKFQKILIKAQKENDKAHKRLKINLLSRCSYRSFDGSHDCSITLQLTIYRLSTSCSKTSLSSDFNAQNYKSPYIGISIYLPSYSTCNFSLAISESQLSTSICHQFHSQTFASLILTSDFHGHT